MTLAAAKAALVKAHCAAGAATPRRAGKAKVGRVLGQAFVPGSKRPRGTRVGLTVGRA
jgi:hypothetical protein